MSQSYFSVRCQSQSVKVRQNNVALGHFCPISDQAAVSPIIV